MNGSTVIARELVSMNMLLGCAAIPCTSVWWLLS